RRKRRQRRGPLAGLGGLAAADVAGLPGAEPASAAQAQQPAKAFSDAIPIKGKAGPGLEGFDTAMLQIMDRHGIPGAALAIAKDGKLVLARGYGWANVTTGEPVLPETLFGYCSLSKTITAVATLRLGEHGQLRPEE